MRDLQRYVGMAYFGAFALMAWLFPRILVEVLDLFGAGANRLLFGSMLLSTVLGVGLAGVAIALLWRNERAKRWTFEVVEQLTKVTWPDGDETRKSTVIVIAFSIILGGTLAIMDLIGQRVIDLVFKVFT